MPRLLSLVLVLGLLGGTATAFVATERLKLVPTPIVAPQVDKAFSPVCGCASRVATIRFRLREADRITVTIVDAGDDEVATIADGEERPAGPLTLTWAGGAEPEGTYRARVHLAHARRTIRIPNPIRLDTTPPLLEVTAIAPAVFSPDRDGRSDKVKAFYRVSEPASVLLLVDGRRTLESPLRGNGKLNWYGKRRGRPLRPGLYGVSLVARDLAGNVTEPTPPAVVRLRFISLARARLRIPAGVRFTLRVSTDAKRYAWRLGPRRGTATGELLTLRAPPRPGRYTLRVSYRGHDDAAAIFVEPRP